MKEQISIYEIFKLFLAHWWRILLIALAGAVLTFCVSAFYITPMYVSRGSLYVKNNSNQNSNSVNLTDIATSQQMALTCVELLTSNTFLNQVKEKSELPYSVGVLRSMLSLTPVTDTEFIEISAISPSPEHSQIIVNMVLNCAQDEIMRVIQAGHVSVVDEATLPQVPASPNVAKNTIVGFMLFAVLTMGCIFLIFNFDSRIKDGNDLVGVRELPLLSVVPDIESIRLEEKKHGQK